MHGLVHSGIVLYINSYEKEFISKASIYQTLEAVIKGEDEIDMSDILLPSPPEQILKLAKQYIDEFGGIDEFQNKNI